MVILTVVKGNAVIKDDSLILHGHYTTDILMLFYKDKEFVRLFVDRTDIRNERI